LRQHRNRNAGRPPRDLLDQEAHLDRSAAGSSVFLRIRDPRKTVLDEQIVDVPGIFVGGIDLRSAGRDLVLDQLADRLPERLLLRRDPEIQPF
jgi:hypothetical protein